MSETGAWLYQSLPEVYRTRDADEGYPLRAFLAVLGEQGDALWDEATGSTTTSSSRPARNGSSPTRRPGRLPAGARRRSVSQRALVGRWIR